MDGLFQLPSDVNHLAVPYEPEFHYDGPRPNHSFENFPARVGFSSVNPDGSDLDLNNRAGREVASLVQSWLFFGLLAEFLDCHLTPEQVIEPLSVPHVKLDVFKKSYYS